MPSRNSLGGDWRFSPIMGNIRLEYPSLAYATIDHRAVCRPTPLHQGRYPCGGSVSLLESLLGRKRRSNPQASPNPIADPAHNPELVGVCDSEGRESYVTRDTWRKSVLPSAIKSSWSDSDQLYSIVVGALSDGFHADVLAAARHLYDIERDRARAVCAYGIALTKAQQLDQAEQVFCDFLEKHPDNGTVLTNLAKVFAARKDGKKVGELLWRAIEVEPNLQHAFGWYLAIQRESGGEAAYLAALDRIAALSGSWLAKLTLARLALVSRELDKAVNLYAEALARTEDPVPVEMLMQISGELGQAGYLLEVLQLVEPRFRAAVHGMSVGNNLLKANLDYGRLRQAQHIYGQLNALDRPEWAEPLSFWAASIAEAKGACIARRHAHSESEPSDAQVEVDLLTAKSPVWLKPGSPVAGLFFEQPKAGPIVCFLGSAVTFELDHEHETTLAESAPARLSRSIPLFLAEQAELLSSICTQTLVPWAAQPSCGFIVNAGPWPDGDAASHAKQAGLACSHITTVHLLQQDKQWSIELRLVRVSDSICVKETSEPLEIRKPGEAIHKLARRWLLEIEGDLGATARSCPSAYTAPDAASLPAYLSQLEQLLALRCSSLPGVSSDFLRGEQDTITSAIALCHGHPESVSLRILLAQDLIAIKRVRPEVLCEFAAPIRSLFAQHPLPGNAQAWVRTLIDEALGSSSARASTEPSRPRVDAAQ